MNDIRQTEDYIFPAHTEGRGSKVERLPRGHNMEQNVIYFDRPTINGRIYSAECFSQLPNILLVTMDISQNGDIPLTPSCGIVDRIDVLQDHATVYWHTLDTPMGRLFETMPYPRSYGFSPVGHGKWVGGKITVYQLTYFSIIANSIW